MYVSWVVFTLMVAASRAQTVVDTAEDGSSGTLSFSTPSLNDEESHSPWIPDALKCDACQAVSYQIYDKFTSYNSKHKYLKFKLPESDILDVFEQVCGSSDIWQAYGIKEVKKVKHLSGPGLATADTPGITAGGGQWPNRLRDLCDQFTGELGEDAIYKVYKAMPNDVGYLQSFLCRGEGVQSSCSHQHKDEL